MACLLKSLVRRKSAYRDRKFDGTQEQYEKALEESTTVYVGNLSFYTSEEQIHELFKKAGEVKRIVMGLDRNLKTPCGFCFVIYYTRADAEASVRFVNETFLDDRLIRVDIDWGFKEGRQYGRGRSGGQVRDERRTDYDEGRGGFGKLMQQEMAMPGPFEMGMSAGGPRQPQNLPFRGAPMPDSERHRPRKRNREGDETRNHDDSREKRPRDDGPTSNPRFRERGEEQEDD